MSNAIFGYIRKDVKCLWSVISVLNDICFDLTCCFMQVADQNLRRSQHIWTKFGTKLNISEKYCYIEEWQWQHFSYFWHHKSFQDTFASSRQYFGSEVEPYFLTLDPNFPLFKVSAEHKETNPHSDRTYHISTVCSYQWNKNNGVFSLDWDKWTWLQKCQGRRAKEQNMSNK